MPADNANQDDIDQLDPKDLRALLRKSQASNVQLARDVAQRDAALAVHDAGLSHLNATQRGALVFALGDKEVNADNLTAAAKSLGFSTEPSLPTSDPNNPPPPPGDGNNGPPSGDGNQPPGTPPGQPQFLDEMPNSNHPDPRTAINASISGLTKAEYAGVMAQRGGTGTGAYQEAMDKAQTKAETLAVISQQGAAEGLLLESDLI